MPGYLQVGSRGLRPNLDLNFGKIESYNRDAPKAGVCSIRSSSGAGPAMRDAGTSNTEMQGLSLRDPEVFGTLAAVGVCLGAVALHMARRKRPSAEEVERERRLTLVKTGRIIDGTVVDISDLGEAESGHPGGLQLILYKYEIAGVVYHCSQDVSPLKNFVDIYACRLGFPCSVRYDSHQPENSIIVAENWTGLRDKVVPFQLRKPARNPAAATVPRR